VRLDFHSNHRLLFGVVTLGFVALSFLVAVGPALSLERHNDPLPGSRSLTPVEQRGLAVYLSEGCVYCHTQQVRPVAEDTTRYGRASVPADFSWVAPMDVWRQAPRTLGSERTGPDLTSIGARQPSEAWQYIHLYQPRAVVKQSIMPAFPWLFEVKPAANPGETVVPLPPGLAPPGKVVVASEKAKALVAYLLSLRQVPLGGAAPAASAPGGSGAQVYQSRCSACHQADGKGVAGAFPPLAGDPVVQDSDPARHIEVILFGLSGQTIGGVAYASAMPAWGEQLTDDEIAAVVNHERTSWGNAAPTVTAADVAALRARGGHAE